MLNDRFQNNSRKNDDMKLFANQQDQNIVKNLIIKYKFIESNGNYYLLIGLRLLF